MEELKKGFTFIKELLKKASRDEAIPYAYQLTYSLLLSIFPFLIFLFSLIAYLNLDSGTIIDQLSVVMPGDTFNMFHGVIKDVMTNQNGGLLSVSIIAAIWAAAGGFKAFISALNKIYGIQEDRSIITVNLMAVLYVVLLALGIVGSLLLVVFADPIIASIKGFFPGLNMGIFDTIMTSVMPAFFIFILFLIFYMFVPSRNIKFKYSIHGAAFASIAFMLVSFGFKFYINNFANYSKFYGALAAVVILMFWLLLISMIMLFGAELNSMIIRYKKVANPFFNTNRISKNSLSKEAIINVRKNKKIPEDDI